MLIIPLRLFFQLICVCRYIISIGKHNDIMIVFVIIILNFIVCHNYYKGEFMYGSYISSRMLNIFSYGSNFSQLPKRDNLHIKDKRPAPNLSVIWKFYCIIFSNDLSLVVHCILL